MEINLIDQLEQNLKIQSYFFNAHAIYIKKPIKGTNLSLRFSTNNRFKDYIIHFTYKIKS